MILELSRAEVDKLLIDELRRRYRGAGAVTIDFEPRSERGFCHINWIRVERKPLPKVRKKLRRGPMRDPLYRKWIRTACACALYDRDNHNGCAYDGSATIDPAHTENNGMRSKGSDSSCVPLCRAHHREYDAGRAAFERKYSVDVKALAAEHWARYQKEKGA